MYFLQLFDPRFQQCLLFNKEGFKIAVNNDTKTVAIIGADARGILYGIGKLLRAMEMRKDQITLILILWLVNRKNDLRFLKHYLGWMLFLCRVATRVIWNPTSFLPFSKKKPKYCITIIPTPKYGCHHRFFRPTQQWFDAFYAHVNQEYDWFGGVAFGPWIKTPIEGIRKTLNPDIPIRRYPDITHRS